MSEPEQDTPQTPRWFVLEKKAMMSDIRLMVIASVAVNQFLTNVQLPTAVSVAALTAAILLPALKTAIAIFGHSA